MLALIGLDSVSPTLLDELVEQGRMPALGALRERGRVVSLDTPGVRFPAGAFPSLWTGLEVEEHGCYYPFLWSADQQRVVVGASLPLPPAIWEQVSAQGRHVLVVDPYEGRPPARSVPTCLSGVQFRNRVVLERWSSPAGALRSWERRIGRARRAEEVFGAQSTASLDHLRRVLIGASSRAADVVEQALDRERPDLLVVMLPAVHLAGHQLWSPRTVLPPGTRVSVELEGGIRDVYASADAALGRIVAALPEHADVVVFSILGMAANTSRNDLLPGMLEAVLEGRSGAGPRGASAWRIRAGVPTRLRAAVARAIPDGLAVELAARSELRGVDWGTTRAFCVPSDVQGLIRLNLRGRERLGAVDPGDADALLEEIRDGLSSFVDQHGEPVVRLIERRDVVVPRGPASERLPDLLVHWSSRPTTLDEEVTSPRFGVVKRIGAGSGRSGNHTDEAWALVVPGVSALPSTTRPFRVTDLSATALAHAGLATGGQPLLVPSGS